MNMLSSTLLFTQLIKIYKESLQIHEILYTFICISYICIYYSYLSILQIHTCLLNILVILLMRLEEVLFLSILKFDVYGKYIQGNALKIMHIALCSYGLEAVNCFYILKLLKGCIKYIFKLFLSHLWPVQNHAKFDNIKSNFTQKQYKHNSIILLI